MSAADVDVGASSIWRIYAARGDSAAVMAHSLAEE